MFGSPEDAASVEALYERGVKEYLSEPLWVEYLEFVEEHDAAVRHLVLLLQLQFMKSS